ncbi:hypothetical protein ACIPM2_31885 [Streptomyces sp. NPDC086081]|uniref:hypothetical protein n=1 Tax=Streptomyces sp. NPDC086081 TaxID=3365749 RepID=UPI0038225F98
MAILVAAFWMRRSRSAVRLRGFHVRAGCPQGPQRCHVDRLHATGFRLLVVVLGVSRPGREELLGQRRRWWATTSYARPRTAMAEMVVRSFSRTTTPARTARSSLVHYEHRRGDVDGRQGDVDCGCDAGPDRCGCGAGVLEEGVDDVGGDLAGEDRTHLPPGAQLRERLGLLLGRTDLAGGDLVHLGAGPHGDHGQEFQLAVVVDGGDVLVLQLCQAGGDLVAAPGGPARAAPRRSPSPTGAPG